MIEIALARRLSRAVSDIHAAGLELYVPRSLSEIPDLVRETGRGIPKPQFQMSRQSFTEERAFWHFLRHEGKAVAGCAAQIHRIDHDGFEAFFRRTSQLHFDREGDPVDWIAEPVSSELFGNVVYMGELEKAKAYRGDEAITHALLRTVMCRAMLKWPHTDHFFAFMPDELRVNVVDWGFSTAIRRGVRWRAPHPEGRPSEHLVAMASSTQLAHEALWEHLELSQREVELAQDYSQSSRSP